MLSLCMLLECLLLFVFKWMCVPSCPRTIWIIDAICYVYCTTPWLTKATMIVFSFLFVSFFNGKQTKYPTKWFHVRLFQWFYRKQPFDRPTNSRVCMRTGDDGHIKMAIYIYIYIYVCGYFYSKYFLLERSTTLKCARACVFVCKRFCCRWFGIDKEHTHILMNVSERATVRSFSKTSNQRFVLRFFFTKPMAAAVAAVFFANKWCGAFNIVYNTSTNLHSSFCVFESGTKTCFFIV